MDDLTDKVIPTDETATPTEGDLREIPREDWLLQDVVRLINQVDGMSLGVTLVVGGGVVTGDLISVKNFFHEYGKLWKEGFTSKAAELAEMFDQQWREFGDRAFEEIKAAKPRLFGYVHLRNARYVLGSTFVPTAGGMLWRGRISEVAGFSIGSFGAPQV